MVNPIRSSPLAAVRAKFPSVVRYLAEFESDRLLGRFYAKCNVSSVPQAPMTLGGYLTS